jgi:polyphosphate kinase
MMRRNLNRRVETLFPVLQEDLRERVLDIFAKMWQDNVQARILHKTEWVHADRRGQSPFSSQEYFIAEAEEKVQAVKEAEAAESEIHKDAFEAMKPQENELEDTED